MRELLIGQAEQSTPLGEKITCLYQILIRDISPPLCCESYGLQVTRLENGETAQVLDITTVPERIETLGQLLLRGGVTPCTLRDVVEDWL